MSAKQAELAQTGAAAMAHATKGRKTEFKSARLVRTACRIADFEDEIKEALASFHHKNRQDSRSTGT